MEEQTQLEKDLHQLRKDIDFNIKTTEKFKIKPEQDCGPDLRKCQREIALAYTKLQEAKMWVGKCLEAVGSELPKEFQDKNEEF